MNNLDKNNKRCENCSYYCQHYVKRIKSFIRTNFGHCGRNVRKDRTPQDYCHNWQDNSFQKLERKQSILKTLESMAGQLEQLTIVLQDEIE